MQCPHQPVSTLVQVAAADVVEQVLGLDLDDAFRTAMIAEKNHIENDGFMNGQPELRHSRRR